VVCRLQHELASHQGTIKKLLDERAAALEELSQRTQALNAATSHIGQLTATAREHEQLQVRPALLVGVRKHTHLRVAQFVRKAA
jgi:hypothetical protein